MITKAFAATLGALVAFTVWCLAILVVVVMLHVVVLGIITAYCLIYH